VRAGEGSATPDGVGRTRLDAGGPPGAVIVQGADVQARTGDVSSTEVGALLGAGASDTRGKTPVPLAGDATGPDITFWPNAVSSNPGAFM
jgi:hypothetical protein